MADENITAEPVEPAGPSCPDCGRPFKAGETVCRRCESRRGDDDAWDERPRRRQPEPPGIEATDFIIPTNVSGWSLAACYFGLIGFCLPLAGLVFAIPAFICGIIALRRRKRAQSYGAVTSDIRAIVGLILSGLAIVLYGGALLVMLIASLMK
jgi:hypothetical protein